MPRRLQGPLVPQRRLRLTNFFVYLFYLPQPDYRVFYATESRATTARFGVKARGTLSGECGCLKNKPRTSTAKPCFAKRASSPHLRESLPLASRMPFGHAPTSSRPHALCACSSFEANASRMRLSLIAFFLRRDENLPAACLRHASASRLRLSQIADFLTSLLEKCWRAVLFIFLFTSVTFR